MTFDDAFASVATRAKPILDRLGLPGTVFAVTSFADQGRPLHWPGVDHWAGTEWEPEMASLDWAALRRLADAGWEIGSHTVTHPRLTTADDDTLVRELVESRTAVEAGMGRPAPAVCYPYGDVDKRVAAAARRAGYTVGAALPARWHGPRPLEWPRVGVYNGDDLRRFSLKTSRLVRLVRRGTGHRIDGVARTRR